MGASDVEGGGGEGGGGGGGDNYRAIHDVSKKCTPKKSNQKQTGAVERVAMLIDSLPTFVDVGSPSSFFFLLLGGISLVDN